MDIHSTDTRYYGSNTSNKAIMDEMFKAWRVVTVLAKTRRKFDEIVSGLVWHAKGWMDENWSVITHAPFVGSTGSVTVIYRRTITREGAIDDSAEVCITAHSCLV